MEISSKNKIIITALRPEAQPFIDKLKLKRDLTFHSHEIYKRNDYYLIISGIGKINAAIATTIALTQLSLENSILCSTGVAAASDNFQIGELVVVSKVTESSSKKSFYPEMLVGTKIKEAELITFDNAINSIPDNWSKENIADMEGSAIIETAVKFISVERLIFTKVISDHFNQSQINKSKISELMEKQCESIIEIINYHQNILSDNEVSILDKSELQLLEKIATVLSLTWQQKKLLMNKAVYNKVTSNGSISSKINEFAIMTTKDKSENKKIFSQVIDGLSK